MLCSRGHCKSRWCPQTCPIESTAVEGCSILDSKPTPPFRRWTLPFESCFLLLNGSHLNCSVLSEIFLEVEMSTIWWHSKKLQPPLLLGYICSKWRHVAHGTPKLWTTFSLQIRKSPKTVEGGRVDHASFAKDWLARAHPYPLRVSLDIDAETLRRIMCAILPSAHRLQILELDLPLTHRRPLVDFPAMSMPLLERLKLSINLSDYSKDAELWEGRTTAFTAAPRLTIATLSFSDLLSSNILLPWWQLTSLDISAMDDCSADICLNAFIQCTNLVDCTLKMYVWEFREDMQQLPFVVLPHLQNSM